MYQCSRGDGDSCGKCLLLDRDLKCGWCEKQEKCMLCDDCTGRACTSVSGGVYPGWLDEAQVCTHPQIQNVSALCFSLMLTVLFYILNLDQLF